MLPRPLASFARTALYSLRGWGFAEGARRVQCPRAGLVKRTVSACALRGLCSIGRCCPPHSECASRAGRTFALAVCKVGDAYFFSALSIMWNVASHHLTLFRLVRLVPLRVADVGDSSTPWRCGAGRLSASCGRSTCGSLFLCAVNVSLNPFFDTFSNQNERRCSAWVVGSMSGLDDGPCGRVVWVQPGEQFKHIAEVANINPVCPFRLSNMTFAEVV